MDIRDFIYLDIERLKSIIAQTDEGILTTSSEVKNNQQEAVLNAEGGIFGFIKATGGSKFLWQNQATETKSLHDNIYTNVERTLIKHKLLTQLPEYLTEEELEEDIYREKIKDNSFLLIKGKVNINDFTYMRSMLDRFNDLGNFIAECSISSLPKDTPKNARQEAFKNAKSQMTMDKSMLDGFQLIFDIFYKDRIVIKIMPYENYPNLRFVGNLNKSYLRDEISSIIYKYGTAPVSDWMVFAQVASIPPKDWSNTCKQMTGSVIENALQGIFDAFRNIEIMAQSVVYPEIAITPIAIYRV